MSERFGDRLRGIRKEHGKSQKEWAEEMGVVARTLQRYEDGTKLPSGEFFLQLIMMGYSIDWLLTGDGNNYRFKTRQVDPMFVEIAGWLDSLCEREPGYKEWFKIEFIKRFPEFNGKL